MATGNWFSDAFANPKFKRFAGEALQDFGYGLGNATNFGNAFGVATNRMAQMEPIRQQQYALEAEQAQETEQQNMTKQWLRDKGREDLIPLVDAGQGMFALQQATQVADPGANLMAVGGQIYDPATGTWMAPPENAPAMAEPPRVESRWNPETGLEEKVQWDATAQGWVPFGGPKAPAGTGDLSATETRELFQTEDSILAGQNAVSALDTALQLNSQTRSGFGANLGATVGANVPDWVPILGGNEAVDTNTLQLKNIITEQALSQLKTIFGAAPTEGERQILLELQGSVDQPAPVRQRIFERAKQLAEARLKFNEDRRQRILSGGYGTVQQPATPQSGVYTILGVE